MGEYFRGWKRKIGLLVLGLACVLLVWWVRSIRTKDVFQLRVAKTRVCFLTSNKSWIYWQFVRESFPSQLTLQQTTIVGFAPPSITLSSWHFVSSADDANQFVVLTTEQLSILVNAQRSYYPGLKMEVLGAPYWSLVLPLTALSAYLLLSKPRPKPSVPHQDVHE